MVINHSTIENSYIKKIEFLISTIPKSLIPKRGIPRVRVTNSLFHSFCLMYNMYLARGIKEEEDFFVMCKRHSVWAFSCLPPGRDCDIFLALKERIERDFSIFSMEHVIFHKMGHVFYHDKGLEINGSLYLESETMADIYANACMINFYKKTKITGLFSKFENISLKILENIEIKDHKKLLEVAELIHRKYGVI